MTRIVLEHPEAGRQLCHPDAMPQWEARGWVALGPAAEDGTLETSAEYAARLAAEAERLAAVLAGTPNPKPARKRASVEQ